MAAVWQAGQVRYSGCCHVLFIVFCLTKHPLVATETEAGGRQNGEILASLHPFVLGMFYCCCVINLMAGKCEQPEAGDGRAPETEVCVLLCIGSAL